MNPHPELSSQYLGLKIRSPFVVGASPLTEKLDKLLELEAAGAGAVVTHSLFEEQLTSETAVASELFDASSDVSAEAASFFPRSSDYTLGPDAYLDQIALLKSRLRIPVIASLNGNTLGGWISYAGLIERAGASALELNIYEIITDVETSSEDVESRLCAIVRAVKDRITIPLCVKLSPFYTALPALIRRLHASGASGVTLFNRFYQPDLDIENLEAAPRLQLSTSSELLLRLRWLAILSGRFPISLILSGGIHSALDAIKAVMAGADALQMVSFLLQRDAPAFSAMVSDFREWMKTHQYENISQMRGALSHKNSPNPAAFERANYLRILQLWS